MTSTSTPLRSIEKGSVESSTKSVGDAAVAVVVLNGTEITLRDEAVTTFQRVHTLHRKEDRASLDKKSRLALIEAATEKHEETYFKSLSISLDNDAKLDDCYSVNKTIDHVIEYHTLFDMHDVFQIVVPDKGDC